MKIRTKTLTYFFIGIAVIGSAACGYNQPSIFQNSFLPRAPFAAPLIEVADPPALQPNAYLQDLPFLNTTPAPPRRSRAEVLIQRADQAFQRGKKAYQASDTATARLEFNHAIDWMLDASDQNPADRQSFENKLDGMIDAINRYDRVGLGASAETEEAQFEKAPLEDLLNMTFPVDPKLKSKVRGQVAATVSQLPLMVTDPVLGYIHYFEGPGRKTLLAGIERSGRYRPMIQRILDEEGVPQELIHLAQAESGFIPRAVSRKAAGGMWQFLAWRGQQYGLLQTAYSDDRMDPEKATRAAARHLRDLYTEFGDWYLAIAAYNCGPGVVERAVERTGYADFWELRARGVLPVETTNYVPIILAMTIMEKNAAEYGLTDVTMDPPAEYDTVEITAPTSLTLLADLADSPVPEMLALNPGVLHNIAPAGYFVHVPKGAGKQLMAELQLIPPEHRDSWRMHRVATGETLASIGQQYGMAASSIVTVNKLQAPQVVEGDWLMIPATLRTEPRHTASRSAVPHTTAAHGAVRSRSKRRAPVHTAHHGPTVLAQTASR